jgi:serine-type D-Ala-D-Ala carboxypeptidase/endopeptidase (penicillin-binding protein 4)
MSYVQSSASFRRRSRRSRGLRRRAFATVVLLAIVAVALFAKLHAPARAVVQGAAGDFESARAPLPAAAPWTGHDRTRLARELREAFAPAIDGASGWSFAVVDGDGRTIYDQRADRAVAPASVQKLIVAATALDALGPTYRFHTLFAGRGAIGPDGSLDGDLWLIGSGDPSLQSADLRNGIGMLSRAGLRHVDGRLIVDDTALSGPALNPHWSQDDDGQDYAPPTSAISLDGDTIESDQNVAGVEEKLRAPMQDVAHDVGASVSQMLAARKVEAAYPPAVAAAPLESVVLWDHRSAPLRELESHMLFVSDNHYAEQLLRTVGKEIGIPDDTGGIGAEHQFLARHGIPVPGLRLYDGSGLSPENRVAAITFARLLADEQPALYLLLPLGGRQGTLSDYDFTTALGRVRAKTGHLANVAALAGYVMTQHHGRLTFAFLIDGSPADPDSAIVRAVDRLATS